ncbi:putative oxidoreductase [Helianthus debilis subsp. tardiflorus]
MLGLSGLAAYTGFFEICKPKKGEKVFVSAASGSVGNLVGQYAKTLGCYVVGCAGSPDKVKLLIEKLGFDQAFNYKEETDLNSTLERYFPDGIDVYFDNVGGEMLEAAISNMNLYGRVALCGVISEYTNVGKRATPNMLDIIYKRITIRGFLAGDYMHLFPEFISATIDHLSTGKMHVLEDISIGLETVPSAFVGLFRGYNIGKKIVQVSDDFGDK